MTCNEVQAQLDAYIDGLLDRKEMTEIETHIQQCEACANELAEIKMIVKMLNEMEETDVKEIPKHLHQNLCDIPNKHKNKTINYKVWGTLAAAIICVLVLTSINPTNLMSKNQMTQDSAESARPEMNADENMAAIYEDAEKEEAKVEAKVEEETVTESVEEFTEKPAEERAGDGYGISMAGEIYLEVDQDIESATNTVVEKMKSLGYDVLDSEVGQVKLVGINEKDAVLITEQLGKIGRIILQSEALEGSTLTIYLVNE